MARPTKSSKQQNPTYCLQKCSGRGYVTLNRRQHLLPGKHGSEESRNAYDKLIAAWLSAGRTLPVADAGTGPTVLPVGC